MKRVRVLASAFSCHSGARSGLGGGEDILGWRMVQQIARFHEVWVLTYTGNQASLEETLSQEPNDQIHFRYVKLPNWLRPLLKVQGGHQFYYFLWQIKAYLVARTLHKEIQFDIAHHVTYGNDWMVSFIGALLPVPYIRGPGGGAHRTPKGFEKEYSLKGQIWEKVRSIGQWIFRHDPFYIRSQNRARSILLCNREALQAIPQRWAHKALFFPVNGITSEDLAITATQHAESHVFRILSAGTLIRVKGFGLAIRAFTQFISKYPESQLTIVGSGPEEAHLRKTIDDAHLHSKIKLQPAVPRSTLLAQMAASDVFLFPSLRDGGGAVVIEAMSAGKPVVCLDNGGPGTHITPDCGFKISPTTPASAVTGLAEILEALYENESLRDRLGANGRRRVENEYHWDKLGERLLEIYTKALSR